MNTKTTNTPKQTHTIAPIVQQTSAALSPYVPATPTSPTPATADASPEHWANQINRRIGVGLEALLLAGKDLLDAKKAMGHGGFGAMFASGLLRIDQRTAERLMRVADNNALVNSTNWSVLPQSIHSLDKLASLDEPVIEDAIRAGEIKPSMTINETQKLVRSKREPRGDGESAQTGKVVTAAPVPPERVKPASHQRQEFDRKAFKERFAAFLEAEYIKHHPNCAALMRSATAFAMTDFFGPRIVKVSIAKPGYQGRQ